MTGTTAQLADVFTMVFGVAFPDLVDSGDPGGVYESSTTLSRISECILAWGVRA